MSDQSGVRDAAMRELVSTLVYLAVMVGFSVALAKRDWLTRQCMRVRNQWAEPSFEYGDALHELRRDIARFEGREP